MNVVYRFRIYPNKIQQELFAKTFGCVRFVYNRMLAEKKECYEKTGKNLKVTPAKYKAEFPWLKEVDSLALCLAHSRASRGRLRRSTSSRECTALARQYLLCNREFPGISCKKGDTRRYLHFYSFSSAASYVGMIQIRYTGLGDAANSQPDPSGSPVCLFSFF